MFNPFVPQHLEKRSEAEASGRAIGLDGDALELWCRAGARGRHELRVDAVGLALDAWVHWRLPAYSSPTSTPTGSAMAWAAIELDTLGVGGPLGAGGDGCSTLRHPAFRGLGSGRKQATDGPAWTSAIASARLRLPLACAAIGIDADGRLVVTPCDGEPVTFTPADEELDHVETLARAIIVRVSRGGGDVGGAGKFVNDAMARRAALLAAAETVTALAEGWASQKYTSDDE